ncbi:hypothetical protein AB0958_19225 [Streptomyces sp. NPDC006655]|uniref:hypothetical protein n=1 Tax=Streptomyces sp. NPDC006655 TaxID=3156898 RepID=UPI0034566F10
MTTYSLAFPVRPDQLTALRQAVHQADRQLRPYGMDGCRVTRGRADVMQWPDANGIPVGTVPCEEVTVTLPVPAYAGWTVVAQLDQAPEAGAVVAALPLFAETLAGVTPRCDACGDPDSTTSYVLRHEDGQTMQLGHTCVEPYAGLPAPALNTLWRLARWCLTVEPYEPGAVPPDLRISVDLALEYAAALTTEIGYVKRGGGAWTTADQVRTLLLGGADADTAGQLHNHLRAAGDVSAAAAAVRDWCRRGEDTTNDYRRKLAHAAEGDTVRPKDIGLLVSAVPMYLREAQRQLTRSDRESITATVTEVSPLPSDWGQRRRIRFVDGAGRLYAWESMTQPFPEEGQRLRVTGRVVRHAIRDGMTETYLTRCRVAPA